MAKQPACEIGKPFLSLTHSHSHSHTLTFGPGVNFQEVVHSVLAGNVSCRQTKRFADDRMDTHKNARLTPKGREEMVRAVVDGSVLSRSSLIVLASGRIGCSDGVSFAP